MKEALSITFNYNNFSHISMHCGGKNLKRGRIDEIYTVNNFQYKNGKIC